MDANTRTVEFDPPVFQADALPTKEINERTPVNQRGVIHWGAARESATDPLFQPLSYTELQSRIPGAWRTVNPEIGRPILLLQRFSDWALMVPCDNLDTSDLLRFYVDILVWKPVTDANGKTRIQTRWVNAEIVEVKIEHRTENGQNFVWVVANDNPVSLAKMFTLLAPPGPHFTQVRYEHVRSSQKPIQYAVAIGVQPPQG